MPDTHIPDSGQLRPELRPVATGQGPYDATRLQHPFSSDGRFPLRAEPTWDDGGISTANGADTAQGTLSCGGWGTPGGGRADGDPLRPARGRGDLERPNFNVAVPPNGYAWWYIDGISETCGRSISVIAFIGSVFSPWYAWSGRRAPENHVCINVATYGPGGRFTMTDRGRTALRQTSDSFTVGPSSLHWTGEELVISVNEIGSPPLVSRVRGKIRVRPTALTGVELPLTEDGAHIWRPFAPTCAIDVDLDAQGWQWNGHGYFDANFGTRALEQDFSYWTWGRFPTGRGSTCFYDATRLDGTGLGVGVKFDDCGHARSIKPPPKIPLKRSLWALRREIRADKGFQPHQVQSMLDAPFYSRAAVKTKIDGEETIGVHEALDLKRFRSPLLKPMLAVRVPRRENWRFEDSR